MTETWRELSAEVEIKVPFHDVDMADMAWHGHYVKYFEVARCALLDKITYNYLDMSKSGYYWPVIDLQIRYVKPSRFGQTIVVKAWFIEWEHRLKIKYLIVDKQSGARLTKGSTTQVAVTMSDGEMLLASPQVLADRLGIQS